ncbi:MAG: hypothetical protein QOC82_60 [Frankiaceae bacterium]|jgi:hypothetical protein|nr:hypothetical protein [Frankiaceae bacterium]
MGATVSVRAIEDLAAALPHLLGFPPVESLVVVAIEGPRGELTFTLRLDLPEPDEIGEVVEICAARMQAAAADAVLAFVVTEAADVAPGQLPGVELVEALQRSVVMPLRDAFLLRGGRIWSYLCPDPACCPPDGRPYDAGSPVATTLAAAGVVAGRPMFRDRDEIVRSAQAVDGAEAEAMRAAVERVRGTEAVPDLVGLRERYAAALPGLLARCAERGPDVAPDEAALLGCAWHQIDLRDEVLIAVAQGSAGADPLVRAVARLMPAPYDAPAAAMLGWVAYAEGSGVLAAAALERALRTDPGYSLAVLLDDALYRQVPPSALRSVWASFAEDDRRRHPRRAGPPRRRRPARGG